MSEKKRQLEHIGSLMLVEAACCVANNNKSWDGKQLYDIDKHFVKWMRDYIKSKVKADNQTN